MLKAAVSLWSADLVNLASEIRRVEPYADAFHLDVADGQYAPLLLFFPDLVAAIRRQTEVPLEVHLIVSHPEQWIGPFADAGADTIVFYPDAAEDPAALVRQIKDRGLGAGLSLALADPVGLAVPVLGELDLVVVLGTDAGVKGAPAPDPETYVKIGQLAELRSERGLQFAIEADGGIRRETVPRLRQAGADVVVPGSLMFRGDPKEVSRWLRSL